jgi:hypothetical protein
MLLQRHILLPWLSSSVLMFGLSYVWHGVVLKDFHELTIPLALYLVLAAIVYLVLGLGITIAMHKAIEHEWISLKKSFVLMGFVVGAIVGFLTYLVILVFGISFAKHGLVHMAVDLAWQMLEQGLGGMVVCLGIIYDLHQRFLESEQSV